jgi:peptide/nickel transport system substrate-binding protein
MKSKYVFSTLVVLLVMSFVLSACQPAAQQSPATTDVAPATTEPSGTPSRIVWADNDSYYTLDPFISASQWVQHYAVFDPLWVTNLDMTGYVGVLAESWESSADSLSITIHLRQDATFTDGTAVNADAIKWDIDYYKDPEVGSPFGGWMVDVVDSVEVVDPFTLKINLKTPYAPFYYWMAQMVFPSPTAYQQLGADAFANAPVGSSAFKVVENVPDSHILYEKNPDFHWYPSFIQNPGPSKVDEFEVKFGLEEQVAFAQLQTGEIDVAVVPAANVDAALADPNLEVVQRVQAGIQYLGFNTEVAPFSDVAFRKALTNAINRDELIQVGYEGKAIPVWSPLSPAVFGWSDTFEEEAKASEPFDAAQAIQKLTDAGYVDVNGDGFIEDKDGNPMELTLMYTDNVINKLVCETLQGQLKDVGLNVVLEAAEGQVIMDATKVGSHQMIYWAYGLSDATILSYLFKSNRIGGSNRTRFNSPEMDRLLDIMESEMNPDVRLEKVIDAMRYEVEQRPFISLFAQNRYYAFRKSEFTGVIFDSAGVPYFGDATPVQ